LQWYCYANEKGRNSVRKAAMQVKWAAMQRDGSQVEKCMANKDMEGYVMR
jgi:hypothetical protein